MKPGDTAVFQFAIIGNSFYAWLNGRLLGAVRPSDNMLDEEGELKLAAKYLVLDSYEYLPLDGLSEEDARRVLGLEDVVPTIVPVPGNAADSPSAAVRSETLLGGPSVLPIGKPGRLRSVGTMMNGKAPDLSNFGDYDDLVDVAGSSDRWVALRSSGETISSNGFADFENIRRIARSFGGEYCFLDTAGRIRFIRGLEMDLPPVVEDNRVMDAACGNSHGVALLESGETVVFGRRYQEAVDDPSIATGTGTPRWPQPPASVLKNVKAVAAINTHAAALHNDGSVSVWGWNGPITWEPETAMKPIIQIVSAQDAIRMLDENGQVWEFSLPRNAHPDQPVGFNGKVRRLETQAVRLRDHLWLRKDGTWWGDTSYPPNLELLRAGNLNGDVAFVLKAGTSASASFGYLLWIDPVESSVFAISPTAPAKPGRLRAAGTSADHKPHNLSKFDAYDDFVDVAGGWGGLWVALRKNGETVSSDGKADFTEISKIAASYQEEYAFITAGGKLVIPPYQEWKLPPDFEKGVVDAALGSEHGIVLMEDGRAVVFGARYERVLGDPTDPMGLGTPRWPMPQARALVNVKAVAATATHAATLHEDGTLSLWGWEGPVEWRVDPRQRPLRQIRSSESSVWALDEAGQLWRLDLPRNPSPNQPVYITGKPNLIESGIVRMEERSWCRKNNEWATDLTSRDGAEMLKQAGIGGETVFSLNGGVTDGRVYVSLLWIEPSGESASTTPFTDREAAEWLFGLGYPAASVSIRLPGEDREIMARSLAELPAGSFEVVKLLAGSVTERVGAEFGGIADADVSRLSELKSLTTVELLGKASGASLALLAHHPGLESLRLNADLLRAEDLRHLRGSLLKSLQLGRLRVTDVSSLSVLTTMPNLVELQFIETLDTTLVKNLPTLPNLETFRASKCVAVTDEIMPVLVERFPGLFTLDFEGCLNIKGGNLGLFDAMSRLRSLGLSQTQLDDENLSHLANQVLIEKIVLNQTRITDASIPILKGFPRLEMLELKDTRLSAAGIDAFEKIRPDITVAR